MRCQQTISYKQGSIKNDLAARTLAIVVGLSMILIFSESVGNMDDKSSLKMLWFWHKILEC